MGLGKEGCLFTMVVMVGADDGEESGSSTKEKGNFAEL